MISQSTWPSFTLSPMSAANFLINPETLEKMAVCSVGLDEPGLCHREGHVPPCGPDDADRLGAALAPAAAGGSPAPAPVLASRSSGKWPRPTASTAAAARTANDASETAMCPVATAWLHRGPFRLSDSWCLTGSTASIEFGITTSSPCPLRIHPTARRAAATARRSGGRRATSGDVRASPPS